MAEPGHLKPFCLDRSIAGLTTEAEELMIQDHLLHCEQCAKEVGRLRSQAQSFLERNPPGIRAAQLSALSCPEPRPRTRWWIPALATGAAALVAAILFLVTTPTLDEQPDILTKGGPAVTFQVFRASESRTWVGQSGAPLRAGDRLQLELNPKAYRHVAVYLLVQDGDVSHLLSLATDGPLALPQSLQLDESRALEQLLIVFSSAPVPEEEVRQAAREALHGVGGRIDNLESILLPSSRGAVVRSILIRKE